jgi:hypothetical protein
VSVHGDVLGSGSGFSKQEAERQAARDAIARLGEGSTLGTDSEAVTPLPEAAGFNPQSVRSTRGAS